MPRGGGAYVSWARAAISARVRNAMDPSTLPDGVCKLLGRRMHYPEGARCRRRTDSLGLERSEVEDHAREFSGVAFDWVPDVDLGVLLVKHLLQTPFIRAQRLR